MVERSLDADLALALVLNGRELLRDDPPLKVLLMSATLEGERLSALLDDAPVVSSEGRMYPVEIRWGRPLQQGEQLEARVEATVLQALDEQAGSVLAFLPGQAEIRRVQQRLEGSLEGYPGVRLCPLHGELDLAAQRAAIEPAATGERKVVLATNIAETSLTIEGVRVVVDAGLARVPRFDPGTGMTRLDTQRISRASATQRAGRAGRLEPGVCYRLWSEAQHEQLAAYDSAEILQADLAGLALQLHRWGAEPDQLRWLDAPPVAALAQANDLLTRLGALDATGRLGAHGQAMASLPAHPRIAHLLLRAKALGLEALGCDLAALLGERDIARDGGKDLHRRMALVQGGRAPQRIKQLSKQYRGLLSGQPAPTQSVSEPQADRWLGALLAQAYPDRIAQQRRPGGADYRLVIADLGSRQGQREERIYLATDLDPGLFDTVLSDQVQRREVLEWDEKENTLRAEAQWRVGDLVLRREPLTDLSEAARSQALVDLVRRKGLALLPWTPDLRQWQARVQLLRGLDLGTGSSEWPNVSDEALLATLEEWLTPWLGKVTRLAHFAQLDLHGIFQGLLPWPLPQRLNELAPTHLCVPSGSSIRLDYSEHPPILAVRLQELFGLTDTPRIAGGRQQVKLHLLSPARRPVQVTQDLANFWRSTYAEVKKDLKGRYPKHYWPDDPLVAEATARAKPRGT
jgi:ATP-dependent helicase HrpB